MGMTVQDGVGVLIGLLGLMMAFFGWAPYRHQTRRGDDYRKQLEDASVRVNELFTRIVTVEAAVQRHYDQRGDDRCPLDDLKLYHDVLGVEPDPYVTALPPEDQMLESCRRYIRQRQDPRVMGSYPLGFGCMTIKQLEDEVAFYRDACVKMSHEIEQVLGKAMGYPPLYPDASSVDDGTVGVGPNVAESLADEAAERIQKSEAELTELKRERLQLKAELEFQKAEIARLMGKLATMVNRAVSLGTPDALSTIGFDHFDRRCTPKAETLPGEQP